MVGMKRYLHASIEDDLAKKMVLLTGPRQVGKTFLAKEIAKKYIHPQYLNYDAKDDATIIQSKFWNTHTDLLIFDEIHKMHTWKPFLKGTFDTRSPNQHILVTGSSRMETFRQTGESLAGRYFHYRLHPLSVCELKSQMSPHTAVEQLNRLGGFPEPFLSGSETEAARWRNQYYTDLIREDIVEYSRIHEIRGMRLLVEMLRKRVGSPLSYSSLARDLQIAPNTIRKYVDILESLLIVFTVRPYHTNIARSILKEPKLYFFDSGFVMGDEGIRLENTVAACLLKHTQFLQDTQGKTIELNYIRTKDDHEVDFALTQDGRLQTFIEVKLTDPNPSANLRYFMGHYDGVQGIQLVHNLRQAQTRDGIQINPAGSWLSELSA